MMDCGTTKIDDSGIVADDDVAMVNHVPSSARDVFVKGDATSDDGLSTDHLSMGCRLKNPAPEYIPLSTWPSCTAQMPPRKIHREIAKMWHHQPHVNHDSSLLTTTLLPLTMSTENPHEPLLSSFITSTSTVDSQHPDVSSVLLQQEPGKESPKAMSLNTATSDVTASSSPIVSNKESHPVHPQSPNAAKFDAMITVADCDPQDTMSSNAGNCLVESNTAMTDRVHIDLNTETPPSSPTKAENTASSTCHTAIVAEVAVPLVQQRIIPLFAHTAVDGNKGEKETLPVNGMIATMRDWSPTCHDANTAIAHNNNNPSHAHHNNLSSVPIAMSGTTITTDQSMIPSYSSSLHDRLQGTTEESTRAMSYTENRICKTLCKFYAQGNCQRGIFCTFLHEKPKKPCDLDGSNRRSSDGERGDGFGDFEGMAAGGRSVDSRMRASNVEDHGRGGDSATHSRCNNRRTSKRYQPYECRSSFHRDNTHVSSHRRSSNRRDDESAYHRHDHDSHRYASMQKYMSSSRRCMDSRSESDRTTYRDGDYTNNRCMDIGNHHSTSTISRNGKAIRVLRYSCEMEESLCRVSAIILWNRQYRVELSWFAHCDREDESFAVHYMIHEANNSPPPPFSSHRHESLVKRGLTQERFGYEYPPTVAQLCHIVQQHCS